MRSDEVFYAALREPRRNQMSYWVRALEEHRRHESFRTQGWAFSRELGFSCGCSGCDQEWRLNLTQLRDLIPEARERYQRLYQAGLHAGAKKQRREVRRASMRARALLHSQLTKEQRWELRASKAFTIVGRDGKTYRITEGSASNVLLLEEGSAIRRFCVVAKDLRLPVYDLMLAQKLLLETAPEDFHKLAVVQDLPLPALPSPEVADEDIDNPDAWLCRQAPEFAEVG
jgi:hypothetical protein